MERLGKALSLRSKERLLPHESMCYPASIEAVIGHNYMRQRYVRTLRHDVTPARSRSHRFKARQFPVGVSLPPAAGIIAGGTLVSAQAFDTKLTGDDVMGAFHPFFVKGDIKALRASCHLAHNRYIVRGAML
jgi:hypothetical protein